MLKPFAAAAALLFATAVPSAQAALVINALNPPGGALVGAPGDLLGWGFTLTNDAATDWLFLTASDFVPGPGWWSYTDFFVSNAVLLGPNATLTQSFDAASSSGIGSFLIDALANPGDTITGLLRLIYDGFDADPLAGGANQTLFSVTVDTAAAVTVRAPAQAPEPSAAALLALGLGGVAALRRRARRLRPAPPGCGSPRGL